MKKAILQCAFVLSVVNLMALAQPSESYQTSSSDSNQCNEVFESAKYNIKSNEKAAQIRSASRLFEFYFNKNLQNTQYKNIDKNPNYLNQNFGLISGHDFELLCQLVAAEAENQCFEGKRAVAGVVLNRSEHGWPFEAGIEGAIFQDGAFSCISDGRFFTASEYVSNEDKEAVAAELSERKYSEYFYFTAGHYGQYGTPAEQIGDHFFCTL